MKNNTKNKMTINLTPENPLSPIGFGLLVELESDVITKCTPQLGFNHKSLEKATQNRLFSQYIPMSEKIDYLSGFFCAQAYLSALEQLSDVELPKKAQYIRVLTMELNRISSHLRWLAAYLAGFGVLAPANLAYKLRGKILNIFENITGGRMSHNYYVFGGVRSDISKENLIEISNFKSDFNKELNTLENLISKNPVIIDSSMDIGVLSTQYALEYSITGVNLRASGLNLDFRKEKPYLVYNELKFHTPTAFEGDSYSRYLLRMEEMKISADLVKQCADWLLANQGEIFNLKIGRAHV